MKLAPAIAIVLLSVAACGDEQKRPAAPTAPTASAAATSVTATPIDAHAWTVCLRYASDRALIAAELKETPTSEKLQKRMASLERLIKGACQ